MLTVFLFFVFVVAFGFVLATNETQEIQDLEVRAIFDPSLKKEIEAAQKRDKVRAIVLAILFVLPFISIFFI